MRVAPHARSTSRHALDLVLDRIGAAVALAEQDRRRVEVVAGVDEALDRGGHRLVHHLEAGRDDAGGDDRRDRVAGVATSSKLAMMQRAVSGVRQQLAP